MTGKLGNSCKINKWNEFDATICCPARSPDLNLIDFTNPGKNKNKNSLFLKYNLINKHIVSFLYFKANYV